MKGFEWIAVDAVNGESESAASCAIIKVYGTCFVGVVVKEFSPHGIATRVKFIHALAAVATAHALK